MANTKRSSANLSASAGPADMLADGLDQAAKTALRQVSVESTPATVRHPNQAPESVAKRVAVYLGFLADA